jgi:HPt (histidine-containing phosphotransfer) domain-containing protein
MSDLVDLTNLREMTDGDKEMEQELFEEFFSSSQEAINIMQNNCVDGENEAWRSQAHALKGTALNLGAQSLGKKFEQAQENHAVSGQEKQAMLDAIKAEYAQVKSFLEAALEA